MPEERLGNHEARLEVLEEESLRVRNRLHEIDGDRVTVRLLMEQVKHLATSLENFYSHGEHVAELAVENVLRRHQEQKRDGRRYWIGWAAFAIMSVSALASVSNMLFLHFHI